MELSADSRIPFPPAVVFAACRDEMPRLLPYLPSIRSIEVTGRTETHAFTSAVRCRGHDRFLQDGPDKTLLEIRGVIEVDARKITGVPGFLAGAVGRSMERYLVERIQSDLVKTTEGLALMLDEVRKAS